MVRVVWRDAHTVFEHWDNPDALTPDPLYCETVGYLIPHAKPAHVVVALNRTVDGLVGDGIAIPEAMVDEVIVLEEERRTWRQRLRSRLTGTE